MHHLGRSDDNDLSYCVSKNFTFSIYFFTPPNEPPGRIPEQRLQMLERLMKRVQDPELQLRLIRFARHQLIANDESVNIGMDVVDVHEIYLDEADLSEGVVGKVTYRPSFVLRTNDRSEQVHH